MAPYPPPLAGPGAGPPLVVRDPHCGELGLADPQGLARAGQGLPGAGRGGLASAEQSRVGQAAVVTPPRRILASGPQCGLDPGLWVPHTSDKPALADCANVPRTHTCPVTMSCPPGPQGSALGSW